MSYTKTATTAVVASIVGIAMVAMMFVAAVQTTHAQATSLSQLVELLIAAGIIAPEKAAAARAAVGGAATSYTFTADLKMGDTGAEVKELQKALNAKGYTVAATGAGSAGNETSYFGGLTKSALMRYQTAMGVTATGMLDAATRAKLNATTATTSTNTTTTTTTGSTGITTPGVEGTLTATASSAGLASTVYEGDTMRGILGAKVEAKNSDIAVQRVKLDLGTETKIYNKIYKKIHVTDGTNVLASSDLNSSTVVKDGTRYYITISGFNFIVPKDSKKDIVIKADLHGSIDSGDQTSYTVRFAANGLRGVDGAGIDQYSPTNATDITRDTTVSADLTESATLAISTNASTPKQSDVVASLGSSENELDKVELLKVDLRAEKDDVTITDLAVDIVKTGTGGATASTTVYVFDGNTEVDSASWTSADGDADFSDIDYVVPKGTTKTLTIKADIRNANGTVSQIAADIDTADVTAENSRGDSITESGSAAGETMYVRNAGPEFTLVSKSISTSGVAQSDTANSLSTSTLTAKFTVKIKAVGGDIMFGTTASGTPAFASSTTGFKVYRNSVYDGLISSVSTTSDYAAPSSGVTTTGLTNSFKLAENQTVEVPVTFAIQGRNSAGTSLTRGSVYSVGLEGIQWVGPAGADSSTFMAGRTEWRTDGVSFP